ncbi:MAG: hypothetical protein J6N52_07150 [Clostridia bacterium]|nr:hypothetical protein [Clostridia bacterium]
MKYTVKRITVFVMTAVIMLQLFTFPAAARGGKGFGFSIITDNENNILQYSESLSLTGRFSNMTDNEMYVQLEAGVSDHYGKTLWTDSCSVRVGANTMLTKPITPKNISTGLYNIWGTVTADGISQEFSTDFFVRGSGTNDPDIGVCTHFAFKNHTVTNDDVLNAQRAGFSMIRDECWWGDVETKKGVMAIPMKVSAYVDFANNNGIEVLMPLNYCNRFYCDVVESGKYAGDYKMPYTDLQIEAYASYCAFVAKSFKGRVKYFEIWNEPDGLDYNHDLNNTGTPENYARLLKAAYEAIKAVNPEAYVLGVSGAGASQSVWFIKRVLAAGGGAYMDALSVHPYIWTRSPLDEVNKTFESEITSITDAMEQYGIKKPVWATEAGYSSGVMSDGSVWRSEEQAGAYDVRTCLLNKADGRVDKLFIYELKNRDEGSEPANNMGILDTKGKPRKGYYMLSAYNSFINGTVYDEKYVWNVKSSAEKETSDDDGVRYSGYSIYRFRDDNKDVFVMWTKGGDEYTARLKKSSDKLSASLSGNNDLMIDLTADNAGRQINMYDAYGNDITGSSFKLDFKPVYVVCTEPERADSYTLSTDGENVIIRGVSKNSGKNITVEAVSGEKTVYIDQASPDADGNYEFSFKLPDEKLCRISFYDGTAVNKRQVNPNAVLTLYKNGSETDALKGLKKGDVIKVSAELAGIGLQAMIAGGVYENGRLKRVCGGDVQSGKAEIELGVMSDNENVMIFLMTDKLKPLINKFE